jgi:hypothetical protein
MPRPPREFHIAQRGTTTEIVGLCGQTKLFNGQRVVPGGAVKLPPDADGDEDRYSVTLKNGQQLDLPRHNLKGTQLAGPPDRIPSCPPLAM